MPPKASKRKLSEDFENEEDILEAKGQTCMAKAENITAEETAGNSKESTKDMDISNDEPSLPSTSEGPQISKKLENQTLSYPEDLGPCSSEQSKSKEAGHVENQRQEDVLESNIRMECEEGLATNSDFFSLLSLLFILKYFISLKYKSMTLREGEFLFLPATPCTPQPNRSKVFGLCHGSNPHGDLV